MKRSLRFGPSNARRNDSANWWVVREGKRVWTGPVYGLAWRKRYDTPEWEGKPKPAPSYNFCVPMSHWKHQDVCALGTRYPECRSCVIPAKYMYRVYLPVRQARKARQALKNAKFCKVDSGVVSLKLNLSKR